jgi:hypothetical protein
MESEQEPQTKTLGFGKQFLISLSLGFVLQILVPAVLTKMGFKNAGLLSIYPGLLPILWATRGWFASLAPGGIAVMMTTLVYGFLIFAGSKFCMRCREWAR